MSFNINNFLGKQDTSWETASYSPATTTSDSSLTGGDALALDDFNFESSSFTPQNSDFAVMNVANKLIPDTHTNYVNFNDVIGDIVKDTNLPVSKQSGLNDSGFKSFVNDISQELNISTVSTSSDSLLPIQPESNTLSTGSAPLVITPSNYDTLGVGPAPRRSVPEYAYAPSEFSKEDVLNQMGLGPGGFVESIIKQMSAGKLSIDGMEGLINPTDIIAGFSYDNFGYKGVAVGILPVPQMIEEVGNFLSNKPISMDNIWDNTTAYISWSKTKGDVSSILKDQIPTNGLLSWTPSEGWTAGVPVMFPNPRTIPKNIPVIGGITVKPFWNVQGTIGDGHPSLPVLNNDVETAYGILMDVDESLIGGKIKEGVKNLPAKAVEMVFDKIPTVLTRNPYVFATKEGVRMGALEALDALDLNPLVGISVNFSRQGEGHNHTYTRKVN